MNFIFSIKVKIKEAWLLYKINLGSFLLLTVLTFVFSSVGGNNKSSFSILLIIINIFISYIWMRSLMNLVDKNEFIPFTKEIIPSLIQYWNFISTVILSALILLVGFIFLIIPGMYLSGRLMFASYLSVEKNQNAISSIRESWNMTRGYGWKIFRKGFIIGLFIILGMLALFVGIFITYPLGIIVLMMLYRDFSNFKKGNIENTDSKPEIQ